MRKLVFEYKGLAIWTDVSLDVTTIYDSYRVKKISDMKAILKRIKSEAPLAFYINRGSTFCMINEWRIHNLLYSLGIEKDRTRSVDLNNGQPWYVKTLYTLLSPFYFHFW